MKRRHRDDGGRIDRLLAELRDRTATPSEDELRELARSAAASPRGPGASRARRPYGRVAVAGAATTLLAGVFGFGLGAWSTPSGTASTRVVGVGFLPAKGWTVVQTGSVDHGAATAVAANVPLDPADDPREAPAATLASLPARGVVISTSFGLRGDPAVDAAFPQRSLPLRMAAAERSLASFEPRARLAGYTLRAAVGRYNVEARIYFGTRSPSAEQRAVAQGQLNRLVVASERITLFARPTVHNRNQLVTLLGSIDSGKANEDIVIEGKECDQTEFREVAGAHSIQGGGWSLTYAPAMTTTLRAVWKGARSSTVTILDRAWVQLSPRRRAGKGYAFEVAVRGLRTQFWKRYVVVQRYERRLGRWTDVKKVVLTESGAPPGAPFIWSWAEFRLVVPKGTRVRAVFPRSQARPCYIAGFSNQLET